MKHLIYLVILFFGLALTACQQTELAENTAVPLTTAIQTIETAVPTKEPSATTAPTATSTAILPEPTASPTPTSTSTPAPTATATKPAPRALRQIDPFIEVAALENLITGNSEILHSNQAGELFFVTTNEVLRFDGIEWQPYLESYDGRFIGIDSQDRIWILAEGGTEIAAWDGNDWLPFGADAGWEPTQSVYKQALVEDSQGQLWLSAGSDIRKLVNGSWQTLTAETFDLSLPEDDGLEWDTTFSVAYIPPTDEVWVGQCNWLTGNPFGGGLSIFNGEQWQPTLVNDTSPCAWAFQVTPNNHIWLMADNALYQTTPAGGWVRHAAPDGPYGLLTSVDFDLTGRPLANFSECIQGSCFIQEDYFRLDNGQWTLLADDELEFGPVTHIADSQDNSWVFLAGTTYQVVGNELVPIIENFSTAWWNATMDENGRFWFVVTVDNQTGLWQFAEE